MKKILLTLVLALMACGMNAQTNDAWVIPGPISYDNGKLLNANGGVISKELAKAYFNETQYDIFVQSSKKEKTGDVFIQSPERKYPKRLRKVVLFWEPVFLSLPSAFRFP